MKVGQHAAASCCEFVLEIVDARFVAADGADKPLHPATACAAWSTPAATCRKSVKLNRCELMGSVCGDTGVSADD